MTPIFISGPHGSGKTTLLNKLINGSDCFENLDFQIDFLKEFETIANQTIFEKCLTRLYHRFYTGELAIQYCKEHAASDKKFLLVDRSIYDSYAYVEVERQLGKLNDYQYNTLVEICKNSLKMINPRTIILNPKGEVTMERLDIRRQSGVRSQRDILCKREDNIDYVSRISTAFKEYAKTENVLEIYDNDDDTILKIKDWLANV